MLNYAINIEMNLQNKPQINIQRKKICWGFNIIINNHIQPKTTPTTPTDSTKMTEQY